MNITSLIRDNILELQAYSSARDEFTEEAKIFLDANENPYDNGINRYPDPYQQELKSRISNLRNASIDKIFLGNGSDEVLDIIIRTFCEPEKDNIIICPPTYGMYKVLADINNVEVKEVLLNKDFSLDIDQVLRKANENTKIVVLCSPNNPTGSSIPKQNLEFLLSKINSIVLVDEAYIDFSNKESALEVLGKYPNLIVSQTLSKAFAMAGIRVGMAFAQKQIVDVLNKVKPPYNVNVLSQKKALDVLGNEISNRKQLNQIFKQKEFLFEALQANKIVDQVFWSDANFLLVRFYEVQKVYNHLLKAGVVVRDRSSQSLCDNCLRITIGTEQENKTLIETLKSFDNE